MIVECYLDAKHYHYNRVELRELPNIHGNFQELADSDVILTTKQTTCNEVNACTSIDDNFQELDSACPTWEAGTEPVNPKWLEDHQSGHLIKAKHALYAL